MSWREDLQVGQLHAERTFVGPFNAGRGQESNLVVFSGRLTAAEVNANTRAGTFIAPAVPKMSYKVLVAKMRAIGGAVTGTTLVRLMNDTAVVISFTQASMTQDTWVDEATSGAVSTNFNVVGTANKGLQLGCTVADVATATHIDYIVQALLIYS